MKIRTDDCRACGCAAVSRAGVVCRADVTHLPRGEKGCA
jgi:hypothetical protein